MAMLATNFRKRQYVMTMRVTAMLDSGAGYITVPFSGAPAPTTVNDVMVRLAAVGEPTIALVIASPGSLSGYYLYLSLFASNTSASLAASKSIQTVVQWLIGSR